MLPALELLPRLGEDLFPPEHHLEEPLAEGTVFTSDERTVILHAVFEEDDL